MNALAPLLLSAGLLCAAEDGLPRSLAREELPRLPKIVIIPDAGGSLPHNARMTVRAGGGKVVATSPRVVRSINQGLPFVLQASKNPITAATEVDGWFFYTTQPVYKDEKGRPSALFISGYAIKRGGREVVEYSVW